MATTLNLKKTTALEGVISSIKGVLNRKGYEFSDLIEETTGPNGERFFRLASHILDEVRKALKKKTTAKTRPYKHTGSR